MKAVAVASGSLYKPIARLVQAPGGFMSGKQDEVSGARAPKRTPAFLLAALGVALIAAALSAAPASAQAEPSEMFIVSFAHESGGNLYHGTFSRIDGTIRATWSVDEGSERKTRDVAMSDATFRSIWDSLEEIPEFHSGVVTDPEARLDFRTHHIVSILFRLSGQEGMRTYAIPAASRSAAFETWLKNIGYAGK